MTYKRLSKQEIAQRDKLEGVQKFPSGFRNWMETFSEFTQMLLSDLENPDSKISKFHEEEGRACLYDAAYELTQIFEKENANREWDGEFFETIIEAYEKWAKS